MRQGVNGYLSTNKACFWNEYRMLSNSEMSVFTKNQAVDKPSQSPYDGAYYKLSYVERFVVDLNA
ncbi:MAG: hypothetical protein HRU48_20790 [Vibrio sp.]|uniref:hypothetical protein n=1 Tax=Vibrio TaxID=662 RepID=UPI001ED10596|nr:hypothetical protein [Vibrio sp.]NRB69771.1 hypothetical protein [Vibrio sp.]